MIYLRIKNKIKRRTLKWLELLAASDCINIRGNWVSIRVTVARRGIIYFYIFLSPSAHDSVRNANEIGQIAKLYSEGNVFFLSLAYTKVLTLANEGLLAKGVGGSTHQDAYSYLATDLFLFFAPFLQYARPPPLPPGVSKLQGNTPRAPTLIYSNLLSLFKVSSAVCISLV